MALTFWVAYYISRLFCDVSYAWQQQEKASLKNDQQLSIPSKAFRLQNMLLCDHHFPFRPLPHKNAESQTRKSFIYCHFGSLAEAKSQQFRRSLQA